VTGAIIRTFKPVMTREAIVDLFQRWRGAQERRDVQSMVSLYAETCVVESPIAGGAISGRAANARVIEAAYQGFPDFRMIVEEMLIDGNRVAQIGTLTGTDTGGFMGLPATGKPFRLPIVILYTVADDLIVHERRIYDFTGMLVQVGILKAKPV
jgi:steroid delta-isomerase-like uncharacterized protein